MIEPAPPAETIHDALRDAAEAHGTREFLIIGRREETISFAGLADRAMRFTGVLAAHGAQPGDRIALWMTNHVDWPVAAFAIARLGCVMVAVSTRLTPREVAHVLRLSGARLLVMEDLFLGRIEALPILRAARQELSQTGDGRPGVILKVRTGELPDDVTDWDTAEAVANVPDLPASAELAAAAAHGAHPELTGVAAILTTSGTTGAPKGVMLSHDGLLRLARGVAARQRLAPGERFYSIAPFFHCSGFMHGLLTNLVAGSTYFAPNMNDPAETLDVIRAEHVTAYHGFIEPLQFIADAGTSSDSLRFFDRAWYSAPGERMAALERALGVRMCEVYGLTETGGNISICTAEDPVTMRHDSDGRPHDGLEVRVVDPETGAELPEGEAGEIQVRGWNVMRGYFRDPESTARAFRPGGWLATGDQGQALPGGFLRFTSRLKDIIRVGGENLAPAEVEAVLLGHPEVLEAAVVAMPDPRLVEVPVAVLRLRDEAGPVPADLESHCRERLAGFKVPRRFVAVDDFPRTAATNRIQKAQLREMLAETEGAARVMPGTVTPNTALCGPAARIAEVERSARVVDREDGGCRVRWRIWGQGQGPRLILLHGNGGSWLHWVKNVLSLSRDYIVMVPDIPGFGDSAVPPPPLTCHSLAALLHASAAALTGTDPVAVVGFSMGSSIGTELAAAYGRRLDSLVLVAAGGGFGVASFPVSGLRSWRSLDDPVARRRSHRHNVRALMLGPEAPDLDLAEEIQARGNEAARARFNRERNGASLHATLSELTAPVYAVWGEEDVIMRGFRSDREAYFGSAGSGLTFLPVAGHWVQFERPEAVEAVIRRTCFAAAFDDRAGTTQDSRKDLTCAQPISATPPSASTPATPSSSSTRS